MNSIIKLIQALSSTGKARDAQYRGCMSPFNSYLKAALQICGPLMEETKTLVDDIPKYSLGCTANKR